ncbi:hypothetical protein [Allorhizocola rhizosphaerae]|uniref:hypothetical protein n=1 Tax=Allorhizocola rhizosphaerae TaxID=1872709 RepID=UPI000E3C53C0|nr:hypothetical protein [Allorhizocola rhizosphaerae]
MSEAGRHRKLGPLQRFFVRAGSVILVISALSVGNVVIKFTPGTDELGRPFLRAGEVSDKVDVREFEMTVLSARVGSVIKAPNKWEHDTQGKWVVLRVRLMMHRQARIVRYAAVHDARERIFHFSDRLDQPLVDGSRLLQPGIAVEADVAFEVPIDAVGLTARFAVNGTEFNRRLDAMSEIALPVPETAFLSPEPIAIAPLEVKP